MADISQIVLPSGTTYNIKDAGARDLIEGITGGAMTFVGVATTTNNPSIADGASTSPIIVLDSTASGGTSSKTPTKGTVTLLQGSHKEFVFGEDGTWHELGDLSAFKALAYKDSAQGSTTYKPTGTIGSIFNGTAATISIPTTSYSVGSTFTGSSTSFSGAYTPAGTVEIANTVNRTAAVSTASSGDPTYTPEGTITGGSFAGTAATIKVSGTPNGSVSITTTVNRTATVSTASGTATYTPEGTVDISTSTASIAVEGTYTPAGTVGIPTITLKSNGAGATGTVNGVNSITNVVGAISSSAAGSAITNEIVYIQEPVTNEQLVLKKIGYSLTAPITTVSKTFKTGDGSYEASRPTWTGANATISSSGTYVKPSGNGGFTGTPVRLVTGNINVPTAIGFTGSATTFQGSYTPQGSISGLTFSGEPVRLVTGNIAVPSSIKFTGTPSTVNVSGIPKGSVSTTLSKTAGTSTTSYTPAGSVSSTFTGNQATISITST